MPQSTHDAAIQAFAKINLGLRILGRRGDGYHILESLAVFCDFGDRIWADQGAGRDSLQISGEFAPMLSPDDSNNIILKLLSRLREGGIGLPHFSIKLEKNIPVGAGFGGGSADAAAIMRYLLKNHTGIFPQAFDLHGFLSSLGADVPACFASAPLIMRGIGEDIEILKNFPEIPALLFWPGFSCPTKDVYAAIGPAPSQPQSRLPQFTDLNSVADFVHNTGNALYASASRIYPDLARMRDLIENQGDALAHGLSGSGSGFFALYADSDAQQKAYSAFQQSSPGLWVKKAQIFGAAQ